MALPFFCVRTHQRSKRGPYLRQAGFVAALLRMTGRGVAQLLHIRVLIYCATAKSAELILLIGKGAGMKFQRKIALVVMLMVVAGVARAQNSSAAGAGRRVLAVDDYFRIKEVGDPQISPDGKWVAYTVETSNLKEDKDRRRIWMIPTVGGTPIALTGENESSSHPRWSPDGKYIAFISVREGGDDDEEKGKKQVWILNREG